MIHQLPYGLKEGKLTSIHDVESGLKCNCTCPSCGGQLVARKGPIKAYHFAHYHEGNCQGALETALHLAAKEVLDEHRKIVLPILKVYDKYTAKIIILSQPMEVELEEVRLEESLANFKPDVIGVVKGREIYIEIAVTHFVDQEKEQKVRKKGVSMIEIDLSDLKDGFTKEELIQEVIYSQDNKFWVYNAKQEFLFQKKMDLIIEEHNLRTIKKSEKKHSKLKKKIKKAEENDRIQQEFNNKQEILKIKTLEANELGYNVFWLGDHICKYLMIQEAKKFSDSNYITPIKNGAFWNGEIYGIGKNGKYVYIGGEKKYIFLPRSNSFDGENQLERKLFGQLNNIARESLISKIKCATCQHFVSFIDEEKTHVSCSLKKH